jgi:uncharacterized Zn finger protein
MTWWADGPTGRGHRKPAARGAGARRGFGATWWGRAWVEALETRARLDPNRLPRGRGYARSGAVLEMLALPGRVSASVQGSRRRPYDVVVRVREFDAAEWDQVLDAVAAEVGRAAALLDGELLPEVLGDVARAGLDLLPGPGELGPRCSCPDDADPCKHAAAVCYLVADLLDDDPFALLLLRGRERDEVLAGLRARRGGSGSAQPVAGPVDAGVAAREVFATAARPPLPRPPLPPRRPGRPATLAVDPPPGSDVTVPDLLALAQDAAARAWELATGAGDGGLTLTEHEDLARRAAAALGTPAFEVLARRAGRAPRDLARQALAWRAGGAAALAVLDEPWPAAAEELAEGRTALATEGAVRVRANTVTAAGVQLRLGRDGQWYRLDKVRGAWELRRPPQARPEDLLGGD